MFCQSILPINAVNGSALIKPEPRSPISVRLATERDLKFIDALQKKHSKMVGFLHLPTLEAKIKAGNVLIAEESDEATERRSDGGEQAIANETLHRSIAPSLRRSLGYCIFQDKYHKHDDCGIFYQVNIVPGSQRGLIGAALVKAQLERAAYGCKLACCWCAQDLEANYFWESLGFVPLAFRTGSRGKDQGGKRQQGRVHIFWQRRIRAGDAGPGATPYWYPSETSGGALKENRIVLPIPPGTHWSDAKPMVLPGPPEHCSESSATHCSESSATTGGTKRKPKAKPAPAAVIKSNSISMGGLRFPPGAKPPPPADDPAVRKAGPAKPPRQRQKNDPKHVAAARELRDRYLEQVNSDRMLPSGGAWGGGKYDVSRPPQLAPAAARSTIDSARLLDAA